MEYTGSYSSAKINIHKFIHIFSSFLNEKNSKIFVADKLIMNIYNLLYNKIEEDMLYTGKYEII